MKAITFYQTLGFHGFYATVKPIDILSIGLGFGVNTDSIRGVRLDFGIGGPVPTDIYLGVVINSIDNEDDAGHVKEGTIERLQAGFQSKLYGDYVKLSFGITPLGTAVSYLETTATGTIIVNTDDDGVETYTNEIRSCR